MAVVAMTIGAACGSSDPSADIGDAGPIPEIAVAQASAASGLPPTVVRDIGAEEWVQLANFLPADKPLLVWFWAPH